MKVKIKRLNPDVELPKYHTDESAAFDLASNEDITVQPREVVTVKTGLIVEAPHGHFFLVAPRSSMPRKKGLMMPHSIGIIDRDYSGPNDEVMIQVYNFTDKPVEIKKGERFAQGMFLQVDRVEWDEVDEVRKDSRGGLGSTGGYNG